MALLLFLAFLVLPVAEIYVIAKVGHVIGLPQTLLLLVAVSLLGAWLVKRAGLRTWRALQLALAAGRTPGREVADGGLVLVGGVLLLTPGFITDAVGLLLVLPVTRPLARRALLALALRRITRGRSGRHRGPVVEGRVLRGDRREPPAKT